MKFDIRNPGMKLALAFGLLGACAVQAAEQSHEDYVMIVYTDVAYGTSILRGAPEKVATRLSRRLDGRAGGVADQINLCVAYTKMKQIDLATRHCDAAVAQSAQAADRRWSSGPVGRLGKRSAKTDQAVALTNRGVLHALAGESDEATDLFELAMAMERTEEHARNNLARLRSSLDERDF